MYRTFFCVAAVAAVMSSAKVTPVVAEEDKVVGILLAAGDIANCYSRRSKYSQVAELVSKEIAAANESGTPIKVLVLGDLAYRIRKDGVVKKTYAECFKDFRKYWGPIKPNMLPVPGNHDYSDDRVRNAGTYFAYFAEFFRSQGERARKGSYVALFPVGHPHAWRLAAFDFYRDRSQGLDFIRNRLSITDGRCLIGFTHPFFLSSGNHGRKFPGNKFKIMGPFLSTLREYGAAALIVGHDHHFEDFAPMNENGDSDVGGVRQFVVGTGGAPLYTKMAKPKHKLSQGFSNSRHGVLKMELFKNGYRWTFLPIAGKGAPEPPSPIILCPTVRGGN